MLVRKHHKFLDVTSKITECRMNYINYIRNVRGEAISICA